MAIHHVTAAISEVIHPCIYTLVSREAAVLPIMGYYLLYNLLLLPQYSVSVTPSIVPPKMWSPRTKHGRDYAENCVKTEAENETDSDLKLVENAYQYITDKTYPPGSTKNEKRSIRRKAEKLVVVKGELLYRKKDGNEVTQGVGK